MKHKLTKTEVRQAAGEGVRDGLRLFLFIVYRGWFWGRIVLHFCWRHLGGTLKSMIDKHGRI